MDGHLHPELIDKRDAKENMSKKNKAANLCQTHKHASMLTRQMCSKNTSKEEHCARIKHVLDTYTCMTLAPHILETLGPSRL